MKHNYQPRLKIYSTVLGKFDLINKYNDVQPIFFRNTSLKISWYFKELTKTELSKLLCKEFHSQQRFNYKKSRKYTKESSFMITLRKTSLFSYFEMLINSSFLDTNAGFIIKKLVNLVSNIPVLLIFSYQNKFFHNTKNQFNDFKLLNSFKFNYPLYFDYYFLPI